MRRDIVWKWIVPTFVSYFIASFFAVKLLSVVGDGSIKKVLGVVLILLSLYFIFFQKKIKIQPTKRNGFIAGALSGALESLFCVGGPPIVLYLLTVSKMCIRDRDSPFSEDCVNRKNHSIQKSSYTKNHSIIV